MHTDFLIVGQGICGTFLSWYLQKAGYSCTVIDQQREGSASKVAAGIINPVTGRRMVKTWLIDEILPFARTAYDQLGQELGISAIEQKDVIDFFPTPQMKEAFSKRYAEDPTYLSLPPGEEWSPWVHFEFGCGKISPCYLVNLPDLLPGYRKRLASANQLLEEKFNLDETMVTNGGVRYKDITAEAIIFCDGIESILNPYFRNLPFAPNKGEVLWVEINNFPSGNICKRGISLAPWKKNIFWVGSSYEWEFQTDQPTELFRERTIAALKNWLRVDFRLVDHRSSLRPATIERRPFIGFHPLHATVGIFNGMGTKGCSLAPFFAYQLVENIKHKTPIHPEANINRFKRILSTR